MAISGSGSNRNVVRGNYVGTTPAGTSAVPNDIGVRIGTGARMNTVGGALNAPRSLISGNSSAGVRVFGSGTLANRLHGNLIGLGETGAARPNGIGVHVTDGARDTEVGGSAARGNWIAFNTGSGVLVDGASTAGSDVNRNRVFTNGGLGINLRPVGEAADLVTPNDTDDPDAGPNHLQNSPVITTATVGSGTTISGTLNSTPSSSFRVDVYRNPMGTPPGAAEGENYVATTTVTTNAGGDATFTLSVPDPYPDQVFTATATDLSTRDTSEFSAPRTAI